MQPMNRTELDTRINEGAVDALVEVLPLDSFREFHLPGAINVPVEREDFSDRIQEAVPDKDGFVVVY